MRAEATVGADGAPADGVAALRLVLGDQLTPRMSSLRDLDPSRDVVLMAEVMDEAVYVRHHKQKLLLVFAAMRAFAETLRASGVRVRYVRLGEAGSGPSLAGEAARAAEALKPDRLVVTEPGEWRLAAEFEALGLALPCPLEVRPDDRFLCSRRDFETWARGRAELRMELFYRWMRLRTGLLMEDGSPVGGAWNYDVLNRGGPPKRLAAPARRRAPSEDARTLLAETAQEVSRRFPDNFGTLEAFDYPIDAAGAEADLERFLAERLPRFGELQDAMIEGEPELFHARISAALNLGLLDPLEVCRRAEAEWRAGRAPLPAVEGFVRQIIGWREFVRGVYFLEGPDYGRRNALGADRRLPAFYWTGATRMACVADVVRSARLYAYAHHIQRLMVTGNLALLLGVHPDAVNDWYMVVFADAYEWVELPNTHGMALFADGGRFATKPYAASGAYIRRMSNYCRGCAYDPAKRLGADACPFNALYWDFLDRNQDRLSRNPRLALSYRALERLGPEEREAVRARAEALKTEFGATRLSEPPSGGADLGY